MEVVANMLHESKQKLFKCHSGCASRESYQHYHQVAANTSHLLLKRVVILQQVCSRFIFVLEVVVNVLHGKEGSKAIEFILFRH